MKRRIFIFLCILTLTIPWSKAENPLIDSALLSMKQLIIEDLSKQEIEVFDGSKNCLGECYELKVIFSDKYWHNWNFLLRPYSMNPKGYKLKIFNNQIFYNFIKYINTNNEFPYNNFDYLEYHFLVGFSDVTVSHRALYGKYKFKVSATNLSILDKDIEILDGDDAILKKYNSRW